MINSPFYDIYKSYEDNYRSLPEDIKKISLPPEIGIKKKFNFLGFTVNSPFGIPAGPLLNSKYIKAAFDFGFDVSVYKTVRSQYFPCHPHPNVVYVKAPKELHPEKVKRLIQIKDKKRVFPLNITNSFGVPSQKPEIWQEDVRKSLKYQKDGQLLILSFMGTVKQDQTEKQFIRDFALSGRLSNETGAKVLEVNLSCPNIGNEGLVCYNLETTSKVLKVIRKSIDNTPLLVKVGYFKDKKQLENLSEIINEYANGIAAINTLQTEIVNEKGEQALPGKMRLRSGVCGSTIKWAGLEMVKKLNSIRKKNNYKFAIIGVGGVTKPEDFSEYRKAGADLVQSATGAMWNPLLAYQIKKRSK